LGSESVEIRGLSQRDLRGDASIPPNLYG
jgi:hypothetical protein